MSSWIAQQKFYSVGTETPLHVSCDPRTSFWMKYSLTQSYKIKVVILTHRYNTAAP